MVIRGEGGERSCTLLVSKGLGPPCVYSQGVEFGGGGSEVCSAGGCAVQTAVLPPIGVLPRHRPSLHDLNGRILGFLSCLRAVGHALCCWCLPGCHLG